MQALLVQQTFSIIKMVFFMAVLKGGGHLVVICECQYKMAICWNLCLSKFNIISRVKLMILSL